MNNPTARNPIVVCLSYAFPSIPLAMIGVTFYVYLPKYYADVVGLNLHILGMVILASRVWDALTDPVIGALSDRTRVFPGRRRTWMAVGVLPLVLTFYFLIMPPETHHISYFVGLTFLFYLSWTMVTIPYEALGPEISFDYDERNQIFGFRDGAFVVGTLLSAIVPTLLVGSAALNHEEFQWLGIGYGILLVIAVGVCLWNVEERHWESSRLPGVFNLRTLLQVIRNKPFLILLAAYTVGAFGAELPATLVFFYVEHVLGSPHGSLFLLEYFLVGFLFLPFWIWLARHLEKKTTWILAMLVNTGAFSGVLFLGAGDAWMFGVLVFVSAIGYGATMVLPSSMQADVLDYEEWRSGKRREGEFVGFWSICKKLSRALGAGIAFPILYWTGYQPNAVQGEETQAALKFLYAGIPSLCNLVAIVIAWHYPITRSLHHAIRAEIEDRMKTMKG